MSLKNHTTTQKITTIAIITVIVLAIVIVAFVIVNKEQNSQTEIVVVKPVTPNQSVIEQQEYPIDSKPEIEELSPETLNAIDRQIVEQMRQSLSVIDRVFNATEQSTNTIATGGMEQLNQNAAILQAYKTVDVALLTFMTQVDSEQQWSQLLQNSDLVRRLVLMTDNLANSTFNAKYSPLKAPKSDFAPQTKSGKTVMSDNNFARYTTYIEMLEFIPVDIWVAVYLQLKPLLNDAYSNLGYDSSFDSTLKQAITNILQVDPHSPVIEVYRPSVSYYYKNEDMQNDSDINKQIYRIGPNNTKRLQKVLRSFNRELQKIGN